MTQRTGRGDACWRTAQRARGACALVFAVSLWCVAAVAQNATPAAEAALKLSRPARPWEFVSAVGKRAGLFGHESGELEAWVYPLKLFRDFELVFHVDGRSIPASALVRSIEARPESVTLTYAGDSFAVDETLLVPRDEAGAVIALEVTAYHPVEVEVRFRRDFQLMWPAALGATYINWDEKKHAFAFGEETKKWFGLVGSSGATSAQADYETSYYSSNVDSFRLAPVEKGHARRLIVIAGSGASADDVAGTYDRLANNYDALRTAAARDYATYLADTVSLNLPDADVQHAYDWARVSVLQGLVTNPQLGTGLIAGYRTSGTSARPGFAWFFGRDSLWTSFALNSEGDFATTKTALQFLMKFQRDDGKVEHEISQAAGLLPWFKDYKYAYASADATPLLIIGGADYLRASGDLDFVRQNWSHFESAFRFLRSTWDERGLPRNLDVGHGWVEGGPLLPVKTEFYQSGLGVEALRDYAELARAAGKTALASEPARLFEPRRTQLNDVFWSADKKVFGFALDTHDRLVTTASVEATVPMWFGVTDAQKSQDTIDALADRDLASDWGMRLIGLSEPLFDPEGYHFGTVWPLFTGWAAVGEYRYHRPLAAYANLRANALLALDGSAGHVTEVLSGATYEPLTTSSPHQIWSAAMVISPILRGMLGIQQDALAKHLTIAPHTPADWAQWTARNLRVGSATFDAAYSARGDTITLALSSRGTNDTAVEFAPALSLAARVAGVRVNHADAKFTVEKSATDQHVVVQVPAGAMPATIEVRYENDFALAISPALPPLGGEDENLKVVRETWAADASAVTYEFAGVAGQTYDVPVRGSARIASSDGADVADGASGTSLRIAFPKGEARYQRKRVTIRLAQR